MLRMANYVILISFIWKGGHILQFFSMYLAMGVALYHWGVMANVAGKCGNQL